MGSSACVSCFALVLGALFLGNCLYHNSQVFSFLTSNFLSILSGEGEQAAVWGRVAELGLNPNITLQNTVVRQDECLINHSCKIILLNS